MASIEQFQLVERDFVRVAKQAGLPEPDEVHYLEEDEEVEFVWHEQKLAVIVELDEYTKRRVAAGADRNGSDKELRLFSHCPGFWGQET